MADIAKASDDGTDTDELYRINDVLTELATELGVPVTTEWEDDVLNDLVLSVAKAFDTQRLADLDRNQP